MLTAGVALAISFLLGDVLTHQESIGAIAEKDSGSTPDQAVRIMPLVGLKLESRLYTLSGTYDPVAVFSTIGNSLLHQASVEGTLFMPPRWHAALNGSGAYGRSDFLGQQNVPGLENKIVAAQLAYGAGEGSLALDGNVTGQSRLRFLLDAKVDGGLDAVSQQTLPMEHAYTASSEYSWVSPTDQVGTRFSGTLTFFSSGRVDEIAILWQRWDHSFTTSVDSWAACGPVYSVSRVKDAPSGNPVSWSLGGDVGIGMRSAFPALESRVDVALQPVTDRLTENVYQRVDATLASTWHPTSGWKAALTTGAGEVLNGFQRGQRSAQGQFEVTRAELTLWQIGVGIRGFWQGDGPVTQPRYHLITLFVSLSAANTGRMP